MKVLITGAAGKLGSVTTRVLVEHGHEVRAVDRIPAELPVAVEIADLLDVESARRVVDGVEVVVHLANHPHFKPEQHHRIHNDNVTMNFNVFQAAALAGVGKIIWASSVQVMGSNPEPEGQAYVPLMPAYLPVDGDHPARPTNPYSLSKVIGERQLAYMVERYGVSAAAIRFPWLLTAKWLAEVRGKRSNRLEGWRYEEVFAFLKMTDAARLIEATVSSPLRGYHCWFPAAGEPSLTLSVPELIDRVYPTVPLRRPLADMNSLVDIDAITRATGWRPTRLDDPD